MAADQKCHRCDAAIAAGARYCVRCGIATDQRVTFLSQREGLIALVIALAWIRLRSPSQNTTLGPLFFYVRFSSYCLRCFSMLLPFTGCTTLGFFDLTARPADKPCGHGTHDAGLAVRFACSCQRSSGRGSYSRAPRGRLLARSDTGLAGVVRRSSSNRFCVQLASAEAGGVGTRLPGATFWSPRGSSSIRWVKRTCR